MDTYKNINRNQFMQFFRDDEKLNELSVDDRIEIFRTVLIGSSDLTIDLINEVLGDYSVTHLEIIEKGNGKE
jgi:hypothetical protein